MDELVLQGQQKWPHVPDAYGYLALSAQGHWHIYDTAQPAPNSSVDSRVTAPALQRFIERNYAVDHRGCWYFQNGPQRVYVMLEKAPLVLHLDDQQRLCSQLGQGFTSITAWYLNELGELYADSPAGCGLIAGRDVPVVAEQLSVANGTALLDYLEEHSWQSLHDITVLYRPIGNLSPQKMKMFYTPDDALPELSGFVRLPAPTTLIDHA